VTTSIDVAAYIVAHESRHLDNKRLQKLVYFSQAWALGWTGKPLVQTPFEAWANGPVDRELWKCQVYYTVPAYEGQLTPEQSALIDAVLEHYRDVPVSKLIELSHEDAWTSARGGIPLGVKSRSELDVQVIRVHYAREAVSGNGPARAPEGAIADPSDVEATSARVIERWREGLDLLASR
jgi:uncharacterized phage-associated protein